MEITYNDTRKDLPRDQLHRLFLAVGWSDGTETPHQRTHFNAPFLGSTLVVSAWAGDQLIGAARALSDGIVRSVLYDLLVDPVHQGAGIGQALVRRCVARFPDTEWLIQTTAEIAAFYERLGFRISGDTYLTIPSKYF